MVITMNENTEKLYKKVVNKAKPFIQDMIDAGMDKSRMVGILNRHTEIKIREYYRQMKGFGSFSGDVLNEIKQNADSKAEMILYELMEKNGIEFQFQYKIGPYTADYLIDNWLVIELDGPAHNTINQRSSDGRKDKYLNKMGYDVLRVPLWLAAMDQKAVIEEINELRKSNQQWIAK